MQKLLLELIVLIGNPPTSCRMSKSNNIIFVVKSSPEFLEKWKGGLHIEYWSAY